jgi:DNA-binding response OmpR family regulator
MRILLAEDADDYAQIITAVLRKQGYEVEHVADGLKAYSKINEETAPDLLITDVMMPGMTGFELIGKLKDENKLPPTIVLTGKNSEEDIIRGLGYGVIDYIPKPFSPTIFLARIKVALSKAKAA